MARQHRSGARMTGLAVAVTIAAGSVSAGRVAEAELPLVPIVSPEFGQEAIWPVPYPAEETAPSAACIGDVCLAAWTFAAPNEEELPSALVVGRISGSTGDSLDTLPLVLDTSSTALSVAAGSGVFLAVWRQGGDIRAARIRAADGALLDPQPMELSASPDIPWDALSQLAIGVACSDELCLLTWNLAGSLRGARLSLETGEFLTSDSIELHIIDGTLSSPRVALAGEDFLVTWAEPSATDEADGLVLRGMRVRAADGECLDPGGIALANGLASWTKHDFACSGGECLLAWSDLKTGSLLGTQLIFLGDDFAPLNPFNIKKASPLSFGARPVILLHPVISMATGSALVAWEERFDYDEAGIIGAAWIDPNPTAPQAVHSIEMCCAKGARSSPATAAASDNHLVLLQEDLGRLFTAQDVEIVIVEHNGGGTSEPMRLAYQPADRPNRQTSSAMAAAGNIVLVVWEDDRNLPWTGLDLYGMLVDGDTGVVLAPGEFVITDDDADQRVPAVAFDGTNFAVVWQNHDPQTPMARGARVTTAGSVLDAAGVDLSQDRDAAWGPTLACTSGECLAAWTGTPGQNLVRLRTSGDDWVTDSDPDLLVRSDPMVALAGSSFLVAWSESVYEGSVCGEVPKGCWEQWTCSLLATRVQSEDNLQSVDVPPIVVSSSETTCNIPAFVTNGENTVAMDMRDVTPLYGTLPLWQIYASVLSSSGGDLLTSSWREIGPLNHRAYGFPAAAFDGVRYVLAWEARVPKSQTDMHLRGTYLNEHGTLLDIKGFVISDEPTSEESPSLVGLGDGRALLAYQRAGVEPLGRGPRLRLRILDGSAPNNDTEIESDTTETGVSDSASSSEQGLAEGALDSTSTTQPASTCGCQLPGASPRAHLVSPWFFVYVLLSP